MKIVVGAAGWPEMAIDGTPVTNEAGVVLGHITAWDPEAGVADIVMNAAGRAWAAGWLRRPQPSISVGTVVEEEMP